LTAKKMEAVMETIATITLIIAALVFIVGFGYLAVLEIKDLIKGD